MKLLTCTRSGAVTIGFVIIVVFCQWTPRSVAVIIRYARIAPRLFIEKRNMTRRAQSIASATCKKCIKSLFLWKTSSFLSKSQISRYINMSFKYCKTGRKARLGSIYISHPIRIRLRHWLNTQQTGSGYRSTSGPSFLKTYWSVACNMTLIHHKCEVVSTTLSRNVASLNPKPNTLT